MVRYCPCVTSDQHIVDAEVDNRICRTCGMIFNAAGARGGEGGFYLDEYDFAAESAESEAMFFDRGAPSSMYQAVVDFLAPACPAAVGKVLDIGCGKGLLLRRFLARYPGYAAFAIEPSRNAVAFFRRNMPELTVFEGGYQDAPFLGAGGGFDVIFANGVLEHLPDPVDFLGRCRAALVPGGLLYIGVPNFENNPGDLLTYDHLSRFTPEIISGLFARVGLAIVRSDLSATRVPMWYLLRATEPAQPELAGSFERGAAQARVALGDIGSMLASYEACADAVDHRGGKVAMYGTGLIGIAGTRHTRLNAARISCFVDDNPTWWGSVRLGIPVRSPRELPSLGITDVVIAANPCNVKHILARLSQIDAPVTVHAPR